MSTSTQAQSVTVAEVLSVLPRRWPTVAAGIVLCALGAFLYTSVVAPSYSATAVVTLTELPDNPLSESVSQRGVNTATESQVVRSTAIAERAAAAMGTTKSPDDLVQQVTVASPLESRALRITFTASSAAKAATGANAFADAYLAYRSQTVDKQVRAMAAIIDKQISDISAQQVKAQTDALKAGSDVTRANAKVTVAMLANVLEQLRVQRVQLDRAARSAGQIIGRATPSTRPAGPAGSLMVIAGGSVGLILGAAAALLRDRTDRRVRSRHQIESRLSIPVLGEITASPDALAPPTPSQADDYRRLAAVLTTGDAATISPLLVVEAGASPTPNGAAARLSQPIAEQVGPTVLLCSSTAVALNQAAGRAGAWNSVEPQVTSFGDETNLRSRSPLEVAGDAGDAGDAPMLVLDGTNVQHGSTPLLLASLAGSVLITAHVGVTRLDDISALAREVSASGAQVRGVLLLRRTRGTRRARPSGPAAERTATAPAAAGLVPAEASVEGPQPVAKDRSHHDAPADDTLAFPGYQAAAFPRIPRPSIRKS